MSQHALFDLPAPIPRHPCPYTPDLLPVFVQMLRGSTRLLDPFGGLGGIFHLSPFLPGCEDHTLEIEPEWAAAHPKTTQGNALALPWPDGTFDAICTSPCYGNRMADHHKARDFSQRYTYRHMLGRPLHADNAGAMQWGDEYRAFHTQAWMEVRRVLQPGGRFILNIKDHYRQWKLQPVTAWHIETVRGLGLVEVEHRHIETPGLGRVMTWQERAEYESVILFKKENARLVV